jgi:hypothetical protein
LYSITYPLLIDAKGKEVFPAIDVAYTYGKDTSLFKKAAWLANDAAAVSQAVEILKKYDFKVKVE